MTPQAPAQALTEREQFEMWLIDTGRGFRDEQIGVYVPRGDGHAMWRAWQARAALPSIPEGAGEPTQDRHKTIADEPHRSALKAWVGKMTKSEALAFLQRVGICDADGRLSEQYGGVENLPPPPQGAGGPVTCDRCGGSGAIAVMHGRGPDTYEADEYCPKCEGTGAVEAAAPPEAQPSDWITPDYSGLSREQLARHATRLDQASHTARQFWHRYALGPLAEPSCLCCGRLPRSVAIKHLELPGIVVCEDCRDAASRAAPPEAVAAVPSEGLTAKPLSAWQEDDGDVLWWTFPVNEAPYVGHQNCDNWPGYHTHWTPLVIPTEPGEPPVPSEGLTPPQHSTEG